MLFATGNTSILASRGAEPRARDRRELRFHYSSRLTGGVAKDDLARIVHSSWWNNMRLGITGWLTFDGACFEQVVEGNSEAISYIAASILADERHESIDVQSFSLIDGRAHEFWHFEGFESVLREANMPFESYDHTNVVRPEFPKRR